MFDFLDRTIGNLIKTAHTGNGADGGGTGQVTFPIYLINLPRSEERRRFALGQLAQIGSVPVMVDAVDGRQLNLDRLIEEGIYSPDKANEAFSRQLSMGEIGCSLSHYNIYRKIVERKDPVALILEDDMLFRPGFTKKLLAAYRQLPEGWGILHLNCPCTRYERAGESIVKYDGVGSLPLGSSAYLISRRGAELMLENSLPIRYPADSLVGRGLRWGVDTYGVLSPITSINNIFPSQIQTPIGISGRIKVGVKQALVRVLFR
ncbi:MAG: glycosyltransferase family 25 protein [Nitrospira sp.]